MSPSTLTRSPTPLCRTCSPAGLSVAPPSSLCVMPLSSATPFNPPGAPTRPGAGLLEPTIPRTARGTTVSITCPYRAVNVPLFLLCGRLRRQVVFRCKSWGHLSMSIRLGNSRYPRRLSISRLTSAMACVTWMSRGQASVQLKMVRQRHTPSDCARISRRSSAGLVAAVEDEAVRLDDGRRADVLAVGPEGRAGGGAAAHRMHLVVSSKRSRSSMLCSRSVARRRLVVDQVGHDRRGSARRTAPCPPPGP